MAEMKSVRDKKANGGVYEFDSDQPLVYDADLAHAIEDFKRDRATGVVEIHFSAGGIAKVFARVQKTYK